MIKLEKKAIYYLKGKYHHESKAETINFHNMEEAKKHFENTTPQYYINKKDFSIVEDIGLYFTSDFGIKCYYKRIDPSTESIESNYIKEWKKKCFIKD